MLKVLLENTAGAFNGDDTGLDLNRHYNHRIFPSALQYSQFVKVPMLHPLFRPISQPFPTKFPGQNPSPLLLTPSHLSPPNPPDPASFPIAPSPQKSQAPAGHESRNWWKLGEKLTVLRNGKSLSAMNVLHRVGRVWR